MNRRTDLLADAKESVMGIMWILKFVALVMPVLSRRAPHLVAFPAGAMDDDTCCPDLQLYAKNTV